MHSIKHKMHHVKRMSFFFAPLLALAVFCAQFTPLTARAAPVYTISNYGDLVTYAALINAGNLAYNAPGAAYALTADIDAGNGFVPLGTALKPFNGVFDGAGFAIRDLTVSGADKTGLFGVIGAQGVVRNVKLSSVFVSAAESAGGIAGVNYGAIEGCYNLNGCVEAGISAGGIVGDNYGAVESSFSFAYAHADYNAGGVAGWNNGTIYQCFSAGHITGGANIGGVAGFNAGSVESCYNSGDVDGRQGAGGVAGVSTGTITDVYNMGAVEGAEYSAAVAGYSYGSVGFAYYNTDRSGLAEAVSNLPDTGAGAKRMGLNTAAMTGVTALNNMDFGQPTRWETRAPDIYTYHPQLKVFAQSADTQIQSLSAASVADAEKFSIVYHLNGGAFNVYYPTAFTSADSVITLPVGVERTGYTFGGWYIQQNLSGSPVTQFDPAAMSTHFVVYARWTALQYTITYHTQGGTLFETPQTQFTVESSFILTKLISKPDFVFAGWYDNALCEGQAWLELPAGTYGSIDLYAKWNDPAFTITYALDGGTNHPNNPAEYDTGMEIELFSPHRSGYTFDGWYLNADFSGGKVAVISADSAGNITLYAKWVKQDGGKGGCISSKGAITFLPFLAASLFVLRKKAGN